MAVEVFKDFSNVSSDELPVDPLVSAKEAEAAARTRYIQARYNVWAGIAEHREAFRQSANIYDPTYRGVLTRLGEAQSHLSNTHSAYLAANLATKQLLEPLQALELAAADHAQ